MEIAIRGSNSSWGDLVGLFSKCLITQKLKTKTKNKNKKQNKIKKTTNKQTGGHRAKRDEMCDPGGPVSHIWGCI